MKKLFIFAVAFIAFTGFTFSGKNDGFNVNVVLNWGITTPAGVSKFRVERSYDGEFYDVINEPACNNSTKFTWKDEGIYPGVIYYRIGCEMNDGTCHYSEVESIRVVQR
jgi:hypothetical protein